MNWIKKIESEAGWAAEYGFRWLFKLLVKVIVLKCYYFLDNCRYHFRQVIRYPKPEPKPGSAPKPEDEIPF